MHKIFIFFLSFVSINSINAQNNIYEKEIKIGLTEVEFEKAKEDYLKMTMTQTYKANKVIMAKLIQKLNGLPIPKDLTDENIWLKWVSENLSKTKFKNVAEAINLRKSYEDSFKKQWNENAELYNNMKKATLEQIHEILKPERVGRPL